MTRCALCNADWQHLRRLRSGELVCVDVRRCERRQVRQARLFEVDSRKAGGQPLVLAGTGTSARQPPSQSAKIPLGTSHTTERAK